MTKKNQKEKDKRQKRTPRKKFSFLTENWGKQESLTVKNMKNHLNYAVCFSDERITNKLSRVFTITNSLF